MNGEQKRTFSLPDLAIRRPVTVIMLVISLLGLGVITWTRIPVEFIPKFTDNSISCYIPYYGSTSEQVEKEIAIPAEGEFRTISGMKSISTFSSGDGCWISMSFGSETDMAVASADIRDRMERLKLKLPSEVEQLRLFKRSSSAMPVMFIGMMGAGNSADLAQLARTHIEPKLMRVDGVADIAIQSTSPEKTVMIEFNQSTLGSLNLSLYDVVSRLQQSNINVAAGKLTEDRTKYYVRVQNELTNIKQFEDLPVSSNGLRLKDIATVQFKERESNNYIRVDGKEVIVLFINKESEANTVSTCKAVRAELDSLMKERLLDGIEVKVFFDQSEMITSALNGMLAAGKYGALMAVIVLFAFLRRIRPTIIVAFTIPASLVVAIVVLYFSGITLNIITMSALIIGVGMLVDNSIVVIENIYRYRALGYGPVESARRGANEVSMAICAATSTTIVVFVPVYYLEAGQMAVFMKLFAMPIGVALASSLVLALTVIPLAASRMRSRKELWTYKLAHSLFNYNGSSCEADEESSPPWWKRIHLIKWLINSYVWVLGLALRWRIATLIITVAILVITYYIPFQKLGSADKPPLDTRGVSTDIELDQNFDIKMAREYFDKLVAEIDKQREELGIRNIFVMCRPNGGIIRLFLKNTEDLAPGESFPYTTEEVSDIIAMRFPKLVPGGKLHFSADTGEQQGGSTDKEISIRIRGEDRLVLEEKSQHLIALLKQIPNVEDVKDNKSRNRMEGSQKKQEMQLRIDEAMAEQAGITPMSVAQTVGFALRGSRLPYLKQEGREISVWAQYREEDRKTKDNLNNVKVMGRTGSLVPLDQLITFNKAYTPEQIMRFDGKNVATIQAKVSGENFAQVKADIDNVTASFPLPPGYSIDPGERIKELLKTSANIIIALSMSILLVFIVMSALFESCLLPLSILMSVPLAFVGVFWTLYWTETPPDPIAFVGFILMVGIVVNNGIVIIDHINYLRRCGEKCRYTAILQAGRDRFRPVMMTALTTILGALPFAMGTKLGMQISFASLGLTLMGGLTAGTVLTLFIVPLFYTLIDDFQIWCRQYLGNLLSIGNNP